MAPYRVKDSTPPPQKPSEGGCGNIRKEFSARTKRAAWKRANGFCEGSIGRLRCDWPLFPNSKYHYDHIDPDWFSKDNELENCQVLCELCHQAKTRIDIKNIAKSKRIINKRIKAKVAKRPFRSWRKFNGTVVYNK